MNDFWARARTLGGDKQRSLASQLLNEMLISSYDSISNRDYIEFFTIIQMINETYPDIVKQSAQEVIAKIIEDHRSKRRQDQISKAYLVHELCSLISPGQLVFLTQDRQQDFDTRNAAVKSLWKTQSIKTSEAVIAVKTFVKEMQERYLQGDRDLPGTFAVDSAACLYKLRGQDPTVLYLLWQVYRLFRQRNESFDGFYNRLMTLVEPPTRQIETSIKPVSLLPAFKNTSVQTQNLIRENLELLDGFIRHYEWSLEQISLAHESKNWYAASTHTIYQFLWIAEGPLKWLLCAILDVQQPGLMLGNLLQRAGLKSAATPSEISDVVYGISIRQEYIEAVDELRLLRASPHYQKLVLFRSSLDTLGNDYLYRLRNAFAHCTYSVDTSGSITWWDKKYGRLWLPLNYLTAYIGQITPYVMSGLYELMEYFMIQSAFSARYKDK